MVGEREDEDALFEARAHLRRQEAEIEDILAGVAAADDLVERARAELAAEADESRADREAEEKDARAGGLGSSRQVLQRRLDRDETTWTAVLSGRDEHESAVDYRESIGTGLQQVVDQEREKDPEFDAALERLSAADDVTGPAVRMPDWPVPTRSESDAVPPTSPEDGRGAAPSTEFGTW